MGAIAYSVIATLPSPDMADEYVTWLENGHIDQVIKHGAQTAMIVRIHDPATPIQVESRYTFVNRQAFDRYLREGAPKLRKEGALRFPPERGVSMARRVGEVV